MINKLYILRYLNNGRQTHGRGLVICGAEIVYEFASLELPYLQNQRRISCFEPGVYPLEKYVSSKFGECFAINDVPGRDHLRIHAGNFSHQILGCLLPGSHFAHIDGDDLLDVANSTATLKKLLELLPDKTTIKVIDI